MLAIVACFSPWVVDGDSLRCRGPGGYVGEVRLLGIDSADYRRSRPCRDRFGDHVCDDRQAKAGTASLMKLVIPWRRNGGSVRLEPVTRDRYGRMVAVAWAGKTNLSCYQLHHGAARYIPAYDTGRRIAKCHFHR